MNLVCKFEWLSDVVVFSGHIKCEMAELLYYWVRFGSYQIVQVALASLLAMMVFFCLLIVKDPRYFNGLKLSSKNLNFGYPSYKLKNFYYMSFLNYGA